MAKTWSLCRVDEQANRVFVIRRLVQNLPRQIIVGLLDGLVHSSVRYCLPLCESMRLSERCAARFHRKNQDFFFLNSTKIKQKI
jgi:hypothetical protein